MKILVINSCVRGKEKSRSYKIGKEFIDEIKKISKAFSTEDNHTEEIDGLEESLLEKINTEENNLKEIEIEIEEIDLMEINPEYLTYSNFNKREKLIAEKNFESPEFELAKKFAQADRIIIIAPFWENSFPAILRAYIENISISGIAFSYNEKGSVGLCKAKKMLLITTRGGITSGENLWMEMGTTYLKSMCKIYGIDKFVCIATEGLDIFGVDVEKAIERTLLEVREQAKIFVL